MFLAPPSHPDSVRCPGDGVLPTGEPEETPSCPAPPASRGRHGHPSTLSDLAGALRPTRSSHFRFAQNQLPPPPRLAPRLGGRGRRPRACGLPVRGATSPPLLPRPGVGAASCGRFFPDTQRLVLASRGLRNLVIDGSQRLLCGHTAWLLCPAARPRLTQAAGHTLSKHRTLARGSCSPPPQDKHTRGPRTVVSRGRGAGRAPGGPE